MKTTWQKPQFTEIAMNAEIGSYQPDFDDGAEPPFVEAERQEEPAEDGGPQGA